MAMITENGTIVAGAESLCSVADADARHSARGATLWAGLTTAEKEQALRRGTEYMQFTYRARWAGNRVSSAQALDWPRYGVTVDNFAVLSTVVPLDVVNACADLALKAAAGDLLEDTERAIIREKIGPIESEYERGVSQNKKYPSIDRILAPYIGGNSSLMLVRA